MCVCVCELKLVCYSLASFRLLILLKQGAIRARQVIVIQTITPAPKRAIIILQTSLSLSAHCSHQTAGEEATEWRDSVQEQTVLIAVFTPEPEK